MNSQRALTEVASMGPIGDYLTADHHHCGALFDDVIAAVDRGVWDEAREAFADFAAALSDHIAKEETLVYPLVEPVIGADGPTHVMRDEHHEMQALLEMVDHGIVSRHLGQFRSAAQSLRTLLRSNGRKEEAVIYPLIDGLVRDDVQTVMAKLQAIKGAPAGD